MTTERGPTSDLKGAASTLARVAPRTESSSATRDMTTHAFLPKLSLSDGVTWRARHRRPARHAPIVHDRRLYRQRHRIETCSGRLKDWAARPHALRPMRPYFHVSNLHRRNRHLLDQSIKILSLALLWHFGFSGSCEEHFTVRASQGRRPFEEVEDGLPDGRHARLWRWSCDFFFSVPLL